MTLSRRRMLAAAATTPLAAPVVARASGAVRWTMTTAWPKGAPGVGTGAERFAAMVNRMAPGRLEIAVHGAGEIAPAFEALDAVMDGRADLLHGSPYFWADRHPALNFFTSIPFGLTATESSAWLAFGGGLELWRELYERFDAVPFYGGSSGQQAGGWFVRPIETVEDFRGLRIRIAGLARQILERLGAQAVILPPGKIGEAMAAGDLDAADWVGPWNDLAMGLDRFAPYYYMPGWHEPGPSVEITVARRAWEPLDDDLKAIVATAAQATAEATLADFAFHNIEAYPQLAERGVEVRRFPEAVIARLREETRVVVDALAEPDDLARRIHTSHMDFLARARAYVPHALEGFLNLRSA